MMSLVPILLRAPTTNDSAADRQRLREESGDSDFIKPSSGLGKRQRPAQDRGRPPQRVSAGITGSRMREGCAGSKYTVFCATRELRLSFSGSPVLGFTSKRGKLLLEISRRMRWPRRKRMEVGYISMVSSYGLPRSSIWASAVGPLR